MREYLLCLLAAAAVTYLLTPPVRRLALRFGFMAEVRDRDVHDEPTPRLGGLAMVGGILAGLLLAWKLPMMRSVFEGGDTAVALLSGVAIIIALGIVDDRWGLDAPTKLAGQVLAAGVMAFQGIAIIWLPIGGTFVLDPITSVLFTVIIVLVSINAINFVDGLDGLAAGIVAVAAGAFFAYSYLLSVELGFERATLATLVSVLLVGVCVGFLPNNFFPARIFMGDTGSMTLGLLLRPARSRCRVRSTPVRWRAAPCSRPCSRCSCQLRSWRYRWWTCCWRSSDERGPVGTRSHRTSSTCTTGCWRWGTRRSEPSCSCTRGRP